MEPIGFSGWSWDKAFQECFLHCTKTGELFFPKGSLWTLEKTELERKRKDEMNPEYTDCWRKLFMMNHQIFWGTYFVPNTM